MMKIYITRDSVCAADDVEAPNAVCLDAPESLSPDDLVSFIDQSLALPRISGGKATWCLSSRIPLAVFAQEWPRCKKLFVIPPPLVDLDYAEGTFRAHFCYFAQTDPETVVGVLRRLQLRAVY